MTRFFSLPLDCSISAGDVIERMQEKDPAKYMRNCLDVFPLVGRDLKSHEISEMTSIQGWRSADPSEDANLSVEHDHFGDMHTAAKSINPTNPVYSAFEHIIPEPKYVEASDLPDKIAETPLLSAWQEVGSLFFDGPFVYEFALTMRRPLSYPPISHAHPQSVIGQPPHMDERFSSGNKRSLSIFTNTLFTANISDSGWTTRYFDCRSIDYNQYLILQRDINRATTVFETRRKISELPSRTFPANAVVIMPNWIFHQAGFDAKERPGSAIITHAVLRRRESLFNSRAPY